MNKYLCVIFLSMSIISGCSHNENDEFTISGEITSIDENKGYVYVDGNTVIKYKNYNQLEVGQFVKFILYSTYEDDAWKIEKIKVKSVEILDTP